MTLTPAQKRLIINARNNNNVIYFFGIPEKTKAKLINDGLVETVSSLSEDEVANLKDDIKTRTHELLALLRDDCTKYRVEQAGRDIERLTRNLFATRNILTARGIEIDLE